MSILAIGWDPELRGFLTVVMGVVVLMGSVYLILATNMGSRLAFLVTLTALFSWMMLMGMVWWTYGIGLRGPDPSWAAVPGRTVIREVSALESAGVLESVPDVDGVDPVEVHQLVADQFLEEGWVRVSPAEPAFGQAQAAASEFIIEEEAFAAGEFVVTDVFDIGGDRYPLIAGREELDFIAFFHEPRFTVVEVAPLVEVRVEEGRAPVPPTIDDSRPREYVYMVRDLGSRRQPAVVLTFGSGAIFLALCFLLHRRERILQQNLSAGVVVAKA